MKMKRGSWVILHIRDHCKNGSENQEPFEFYVVGRVHKICAAYIILDSWALPNPEQARSPGNDVEAYTILKEAIKNKVVLCNGDPFEEEL